MCNAYSSTELKSMTPNIYNVYLNNSLITCEARATSCVAGARAGLSWGLVGPFLLNYLDTKPNIFMSFEKRQYYFQAQLESEQAGQDKHLSFTTLLTSTHPLHITSLHNFC